MSKDRLPSLTEFAARLKHARMKAGFFGVELDRLAGFPEGTVCHFERGRREPTLHQLKALADVLECSADYLIDTRWAKPLLAKVDSRQFAQQLRGERV